MSTQRDTPQRRLVRSIFGSAHCPLTVQQTHVLAQMQMPAIGSATVYRCIAHLLDEGWLKAIHLPGKSLCYERTSHTHHHYFLCQTCDVVITFEDRVDGLKDLSPPNCRVISHEIVLYGYCQGCLSSELQPQKPFRDGNIAPDRNKTAPSRHEP